MRKPARRAGDHEVDPATKRILDRGRATPIRYVQQVDSSGDLEHLSGDVSCGSDTAGGVGQGPGARPRQPDEIIERLRTDARARRDQHRRRAEEGDGREIAQHVDRRLATERAPAGVAAVDQYQGVPVRGRADGQLEAKRARCARAVFD